MKLKKVSDAVVATDAAPKKSSTQTTEQNSDKPQVSRREFLRRSGIFAGGGVLATGLAPGMMRKAGATSTPAAAGQSNEVRTICTHCSVGCGVIAEVQNGVWTGQEPAFDHPFNRGAHCAKGAAVREHGHGERRLKYPTKLVNGKWTKVSWEEAIEFAAARFKAIQAEHGRFAVGISGGIGICCPTSWRRSRAGRGAV